MPILTRPAAIGCALLRRGSVNRMTELDLNGRVALVTGGSRGIGAATAVRLAEAGADVAVGCGRNRQAAGEVAGKISGLGRRAVVVSGDMADPDVPRRIVAETAERLGPADVLVANAGTGIRMDLDDVDAAAWDYDLAVNLRAPFLLAQAVAPYLAAALAPHGVTVNAISPGLIATDMLAGDPRLAALERSVPVGRLGQPAEVAGLIVSVVENAYMTAQTVSVDGGRYPR